MQRRERVISTRALQKCRAFCYTLRRTETSLRAIRACGAENYRLKRKARRNACHAYSDNLPYAYCEQIGKEIRDISDELPFEIPDSWEWCRLSFANDMYTGNSINESEKKAKYTGLSEGRYYIGTKDVEFNHTIVYDNGVKIPFDAVKFRIAPCSHLRTLNKSDIIEE